MNLLKVNFVLLIGMLCYISCNTGDGNKVERLRADSLINEVISGKLSLESLATSNEFMYFNEKYFHQSTDLNSIPLFDKKQIQVVTYRIYQNVKLVGNRYQFMVKQAKDLHIPNKAFVYYQRSFEEMNRRAAASKDSIRLELPDDYASQLIEQ
ncbi:hypothetical protein HX021_18950 [Sphingobacterium sp. N143]|uniref:hypothetical protein n=1 Tax=Sphingobacterium sp. N143 TaxID=2746727 RepID=UPI0025760519|nr:hypothetical protein [Sphingobacterium sp. N143]MDM1296368.1 hypothetical protein [Sphingobacterium sp. N143]